MIGQRHLWVLILAGFAPLQAQTADSTTSAPGLPPLDRYVIDVAALVRESGARSLADVLISQVPGLLVIPGSGLNGGGARIRFAGPRTLVDDAAPLILMDGIRVNQEEDAFTASLTAVRPVRLEDFSVEDIDSIEVIASPATAAIYGPGASGGVIAIHTKRGRSGPLRWEAHAQGGLAPDPSRWPTNYGGVDADNANSMMQHGGCTLFEQATRNCVQDFVQSFDPLEERRPFGTAFRRNAGVAFSGGPKWGAFRLAGVAEGDAGPVSYPGMGPDPNSYRRWNVRGSGAVHPVAALEVAATVTHMSGDLRLPLVTPVQVSASDSIGFTWGSQPLFRTQAVERTTGTIVARWVPKSWMTAEGRAGLDAVNQHDAGLSPALPAGTYSRFVASHETRQRTWSLRVSAKDLLSVGVERLGYNLDHRSSTGPDSVPFCAGICFTQTLLSWHHSLGYYLEAHVHPQQRVLISGMLRRDRFDEERLSVTNPSLGVDWVARTESGGFLGPVRVHAAYGSAGRPPASALETFGVINPVVPALGLRPERTKALRAGVDARLLAGRWDARATLYDHRSSVAYPVFVPTSSGFTMLLVDGGEIGNTGVEGVLAGPLLARPGVQWDLRLSIWGNRNRLRRLNVPPVFLSAPSVPTMQRFVQGSPVGAYWPISVQGYADANGDGILTYNEVVLGSAEWGGTPYPTQGGMVTSTWKVKSRLRLSATLDYRAGQSLFNQTAWRRCATPLATCRDANYLDTPLATQVTAGGAAFGPIPARYFEDADYLKLRALSLSYDLPARVAAALGAHGATISLAGWNLATWTKYSGPDPESGSYGARGSEGAQIVADYATLPPPRTWTLRVHLGY